MFKGVVDTCRECRAWAKPGNDAVQSLSLPTKFLEQGECDLLFYKDHIVFHIIDRTIRLSGACEIKGKTTPELLEAYTCCWFQHHGPFKELYTDGESGLNNAEAKAELGRLGTTLKVKAPGAHASIIE